MKVICPRYRALRHGYPLSHIPSYWVIKMAFLSSLTSHSESGCKALWRRAQGWTWRPSLMGQLSWQQKLRVRFFFFKLYLFLLARKEYMHICLLLREKKSFLWCNIAFCLNRNYTIRLPKIIFKNDVWKVESIMKQCLTTEKRTYWGKIFMEQHSLIWS